jgi:hypothetical protein
MRRTTSSVDGRQSGVFHPNAEANRALESRELAGRLALVR